MKHLTLLTLLVFPAPFGWGEARPDQEHAEFSPAIQISAMQDLPSVVRRAGKEGYVKINFVVNQSGRVSDIWVIDHTDEFFVKEMQLFSKKWEFEPAKLNGVVQESTRGHALVYEVNTGWYYATASQHFDTAFRQFMRAVQGKNKQKALASIEKMQKHKKNLLEETYYRQAQYYYAAEWDDNESQYYWLSKALFSSNSGGRHLKPETVKAFLLQKLALELGFKKYAPALETIKELQEVNLEKKQRDRLNAVLREIKRIEISPETLSSKVEIDATGSVYFRPLKRNISIAYGNGNVSLVEAHCLRGHDKFQISSSSTFRLSEAYGECLLRISGEPGTRLDLIQNL